MIELDKSDRRLSARLEFISDVAVRLTDDGRIIKGELVNLGIGGLAMSLIEPAPLTNGEACVVAISIKDSNSTLVIKEIEGMVAWTTGEEMAVKFTHRFEWLAVFHVYHSKSVKK